MGVRASINPQISAWIEEPQMCHSTPFKRQLKKEKEVRKAEVGLMAYIGTPCGDVRYEIVFTYFQLGRNQLRSTSYRVTRAITAPAILTVHQSNSIRSDG